MEVDELQRRRLFNDLDRAIGPDSAAVLMTYLPPAGWADLATKGDLDIARSETKAEFASVRRELDVLRTETKAEFKAVRTETRAEFASVRQEIDVLRAEMTAGFASVRETVAQGYEIVGKGLTADFRKEMVDMTHKLYFAVAGLLVGVGTLVGGAAALFR
jgi:hypothetical protein